MAKRPDVQYINSYVSGTMAYKMETAPAHKKARLPKLKKPKTELIRIHPAALLGIAVAAVLLVMLVVGVFQLVHENKEAAHLQAYVQELQQENAQLQQKYSEGYDEEEIREIALAMGMIPKEDARQVEVQVMVAQKPNESSAWSDFCAFLAGLFA